MALKGKRYHAQLTEQYQQTALWIWEHGHEEARKRILEAWPHIQKGRIETIFVEADELVLRRLRAATDDAQS